MPRIPLHNRREFLAKSARLAAAALTLPLIGSKSLLAGPRAIGANERVGVAFIGFGTRGRQVWGACPKELVQLVAVCDVNLPRAQAVVAKDGGQAFQDYRKVLELPDVDAVIVTTPDHWHALTTIHACQAGKDVYCEKPLSLTVKEGRAMVTAARKYNRVVQTGGQQRSDEKNRIGCELVRSGKVGKISAVIGNNYPSPWRCQFPAQSIPSGLDWDMWCGQVEPMPFHDDIYTCRAHPGWASMREFTGGELCNWGAHGLDQVQWALGMDETGPVEVRCDDGPIPDFVYNQPETNLRINNIYRENGQYRLTYKYANGIELRLINGPMGGAVFLGENGSIIIDRDRYEVGPKMAVGDAIKPVEYRPKDSTRQHIENWISCIKSRQRPVSDVEIGHRTVTLCQLGNIARQLGRPLKWDPAAETFVDDRDANTYLDRPRRKAYEIPTVV